jgi:hypothetical protein
MKTTRRYHRSTLKKYIRRKPRVASFKSLQTEGSIGRKKLRLYLLEYTKFWKAYKFYYSTRDQDLVRAFLKQGPVDLLRELDEELVYYHSQDWTPEKISVLFVDLIEFYIVKFLEPKKTDQESSYFIGEDFYIDDSVLNYTERFFIYHKYVYELGPYEIKNVCCNDYIRKNSYYKQTLKKLKKALSYPTVSRQD